VQKLFDIDLENLRLLSEQLDKGDENNRDFVGIYKECAEVLYNEIDYILEVCMGGGLREAGREGGGQHGQRVSNSSRGASVMCHSVIV
jgi:predicted unusual protein kinase regulating ubiquinone biosynthesis (AarF/ABC1/UbiB family)